MTLIEKLHTLSPELQREVEDFVEFLLAKQRRLAAEEQAAAHGWPPGFFEQTAGVLANDPSFMRQP